MQPADIDAAAERALEDHVQLLVKELLLNHNPFRSKESNDEAVKKFEVGLKHLLGVRQLVEDSIARILMDRDPQ